ncbi:serine hydrolase, partial [bacterium]|nr:serine hydrolase [bacterium]
MKTVVPLLGLCLALGALVEQQSFAVSVFPGKTWETRTPAQVGMSKESLDKIRKPGDGVIVRHGYLVYSWGRPSSGGDWASATKPLISTMLGIAIREGKCTMDTRASEIEPRLSGKDAQITFRHLATMTSGYGLVELPGKAWAYNDVAIMLYHNILFDKIYHQNPKDAIESKIVSHLQFEDPWSVPKRIEASVRDMARFGLLYLRWGNWKGTQVIDESFVREAIDNHVPHNLPRTSGKNAPATAGQESYGGDKNQCEMGPGHYGYNWWTNENGLWPDVPRDAYQANGHWGNETITVIPSYDLVIACRGNIGGWKEMNAFLAKVIASVKDSKSLGYLGA